MSPAGATSAGGFVRQVVVASSEAVRPGLVRGVLQ